VPYQEKVFGRIEHTDGKWEPTALAYPNPGDIGNDTAPPPLPEPSCASPTDCVAEREVHATSCDGSEGGGPPAAAGAGGSSSSGDPGAGGGVEPPILGIVGSDEGCSCRAAGADRSALGWLLVAALVPARRRRC
jgi:MYXO-CTERM domain-containing protein